MEATEPEYLASIAWLWHWFKLDKSKWIPAEPIYVIPENIWIGFMRSILSTFNNDIQHHFSSPLIFHENRFIIHSTEGLHSSQHQPEQYLPHQPRSVSISAIKEPYFAVHSNVTTVKVRMLLSFLIFYFVFKAFRCGK